MKLTRLNKVLLALVVLLGAFELIRGGDGGVEREVGRLFPEFFSDQAARIEITGPDGEVRLALTEAGWLCSDQFDYPAQEIYTSALLRGLASLTTLDLLTEDAANHGAYDLDQGTTRVRVWNDQDQIVADLVQGKDSPDALASYVRRFGEDAVYRAPQLRRIPAAHTVWLEPSWMAFEPSIVTAIRIEGPELGSPKLLEREEKRYKWSLGGRTVARSEVDDFLKALRILALEEVLAGISQPDGQPDALGEVVLRIELTLLDERVLVGELAAPVDGLVPARRGAGGWVVSLPESSVGLVVKRALDF